MARGDIGSPVGELSIKQKSHKKRDCVSWLKIRRIALGESAGLEFGCLLVAWIVHNLKTTLSRQFSKTLWIWLLMVNIEILSLPAICLLLILSTINAIISFSRSAIRMTRPRILFPFKEACSRRESEGENIWTFLEKFIMLHLAAQSACTSFHGRF